MLFTHPGGFLVIPVHALVLSSPFSADNGIHPGLYFEGGWYHAFSARRMNELSMLCLQVMEVEAFCGVHDMIHAAILSHGSQASLREVSRPTKTLCCTSGLFTLIPREANPNILARGASASQACGPTRKKV